MSFLVAFTALPGLTRQSIILKAFCEVDGYAVKPAYDADAPALSEGLALFFVLSKTLGFMLLPTNFLIGLGLIGAILLVTRFRRRSAAG